MKIAIIDDEIYWREKILNYVSEHYKDARIQIDVFSNAREYLSKKDMYDISLVDIEMPEIDGFETINSARCYNPEGIYIILTTHTEMSRKGYLVNAFRYLDKISLEDEIEEALTSANNLLKRNKKIRINVVGEGELQIVLKDILYIETIKHNILIHTKEGNIMCTDRMSYIEDTLAEGWFYRCHKSYIVNLDEVKTFKDSIAYMKNGDNVDIANKKVWEFRRLYIKRKFECANG